MTPRLCATLRRGAFLDLNRPNHPLKAILTSRPLYRTGIELICGPGLFRRIAAVGVR